MKKLLVLLAVAVLLPAGTAMADPAEDVKTAAKLVVDGNKEAATPLLEGVLNDAAAPAAVKAQAYYVFSAMQNDLADQIPYLDKAIAADPAFFRAHERKAVRLSELGKHAEAAEAADAALKLQPGNAGLLVLKTRALYSAADFARAAESASAALEVQPGNKEMLQYKAYSHYYAADYPRAAEALGVCLQTDNRNGSLYLLRGHSYLLSHQQDKALEDFNIAGRYAAQLNAQEQNDIHYYRGLAYLDTDRFDLATGSFNRALTLKPTEERKADLERLIAETAEKKAVHEAMAQTRKELERAKKNPRSSVAALGKIVENPHVTKELKAQAYYLLSQTGQTIAENLAYADKAVELAPETGNYLAQQGFLRYLLGDSKEALSAFDRALSFDQNVPAWWMYRGICYLDLENWDAAQKSFNKAAELQPDEAFNLYRARTHFMLGNIDAAREDMKHVSRDVQRYNKSLNAEYQYVLGLIAQHDKQYAEALKYYAGAHGADASGVRGQDLRKRIDQLRSLERWTKKR